MNSTAVISALVVVVVLGLLKCNANKTKLIVAVLERREARDKAASVGIDLAIEAAKNSPDLKVFLDKYEIVIDGPYYSKVRFVEKKLLRVSL